MKSVGYILIAALIAFAPVECARRRSKSKAPEKTSLNWWPCQTFQETQNTITLTVHALSEDETSNLFLDTGKYLLTCRWFIALSPIMPLHITVKNDGNFPVTLSDKSINLGKNWLGVRYRPVCLANIIDTLDYSWFWSSSTVARTTYIRDNNGHVATGTTYDVDNNPLFDATFFNLDTFTLPALYAADHSILYSLDRVGSTIVVEPGKTKDVLVFVWAKQVTPDFSISIAKNTFKVDLHTAPVFLEVA